MYAGLFHTRANTLIRAMGGSGELGGACVDLSEGDQRDISLRERTGILERFTV